MASEARLESARMQLRLAQSKGRDGICSLVFRQLSQSISSDEALSLATALLEVGASGLAKIVVARALLEDAENESLALMALRFEVECRALAA